MQSSKIWGILIILTAGVYISAITYKDPIGVWESWNILYVAHRINATSIVNYERKLSLNTRAMHSAPSPYGIIQRIKLLALAEEDSSFEKERLKTIWNIDYLNEKEMK